MNRIIFVFLGIGISLGVVFGITIYENDQRYYNLVYTLYENDNCEQVESGFTYLKEEIEPIMTFKPYPAYQAFEKLLDDKNCMELRS